jgi:peptidoglycan-associated lipoprotein
MSTVKSWCPLLVIAFAGAACHARPPATSPTRTAAPAPAAAVPARPPAPPAPAPPPPRTAAAGPATPLTEEELFRRKSLNDLNAEHPLSDVFFDYDQTTLRDDARRLLQKDAQWLSRWPQAVIRIDGHCDERGTAEYNLSLGDRRAEVVREYLTSLGVRPERMQARSLGKEAPFCQDSGESCWSQNRRDHFEITAK